MAVHPDHQNNGIGQTLLRESIAVLKDQWHRHFNDLWRSKFLRKDWVFTRDRTICATTISAEHAHWLDRSIPAWRRNLPFKGVLHLRFGVKQPCHLVRTFHDFDIAASGNYLSGQYAFANMLWNGIGWNFQNIVIVGFILWRALQRQK